MGWVRVGHFLLLIWEVAFDFADVLGLVGCGGLPCGAMGCRFVVDFEMVGRIGRCRFLGRDEQWRASLDFLWRRVVENRVPRYR